MKCSDHAMELVRSTLTSQIFVDWYQSKFEDWITGQPDAPTTEEISDDIKRLFSLYSLDCGEQDAEDRSDSP